MKNINVLIAVLILSASAILPRQASAQSPEKMSYQAVVRDANNDLASNQSVGMKISILQGSANGTSIYSETQNPSTNANGLISIEIGSGTTSDDFSSIDWAYGPFFIKTETDPAGGTNYSITGTSQLMSVPYALHAKTAENVVGGISETDPVFGQSIAGGITKKDTAIWSNHKTITSKGIAGLGFASGAHTDSTDVANMGFVAGSGSKAAFTTTDSITSNASGDYASDSFVFGSPQMDDDGNENHDYRMFFDKNTEVFRVGWVTDTQWDLANRGNLSVAMGTNNIASGSQSLALGSYTIASGEQSTAIGTRTKAEGSSSTSMGRTTTASGEFSTSMGNNTTAEGNFSTAMGRNSNALGVSSSAMGSSTTASGDVSTAMGNSTQAIGKSSTALGYFSKASGDFSTALGRSTRSIGDNSTAIGVFTKAEGNASTAMGSNTKSEGENSTAIGNASTASGSSSTAMGRSTTARSYGETAIGLYNTDYTPIDTSSFKSADRLFVIPRLSDLRIK